MNEDWEVLFAPAPTVFVSHVQLLERTVAQLAFAMHGLDATPCCSNRRLGTEAYAQTVEPYELNIEHTSYPSSRSPCPSSRASSQSACRGSTPSTTSPTYRALFAGATAVFLDPHVTVALLSAPCLCAVAAGSANALSLGVRGGYGQSGGRLAAGGGREWWLTGK